MTLARYIAHRSAQVWLSTLEAIRGTSREIFRAILSMVDTRTGESHPRHPITLERIAQTIGRCVQTVSRLIPALEMAGVMIVRRSEPRRQQDGTLRQRPNDYQLVLPDECWRELAPG
jgi:predicted transcriptional regulator